MVGDVLVRENRSMSADILFPKSPLSDNEVMDDDLKDEDAKLRKKNHRS